MKQKILALILAVATILTFASCERKPITPEDKDVRVGSFNIAWLGDGQRDRIDRAPEDYKLIAEAIKNSRADILGVQEIENAEALAKVAAHLPDYDFRVGEKGRQQNVGAIFRKDLEVKYLGEYEPISVYPGRLRPGALFEVKKGNFDFIMMVVHFKSTSRWDKTPKKKRESRSIRLRQAEIASRWADSILALGGERDLIVVGDFNETPTRKKFNTMLPIMESPNLIFLTTNLKSCKYKAWYVIDHVVVSPSAKERYEENSEKVHNFYSSLPKKSAKAVSDHCPVTVDFEIVSPDKD